MPGGDLVDDLAAGVILVGCAPGGTSSNVVSYLSKADTALSVTMTSVSTLLAPILTPTLTYLLAILAWLPFQRADLLYTRDLFIGAALALLRPRTPLVYEVHQGHHSRPGRRLQAILARRAHVVAITGHLAEHMRELGAGRVLVAHDGIRAARFAGLPSPAEARAAAGWPADAFIVGWAGRLAMLGLDKGVGALVEGAGFLPHLSGRANLELYWRASGRTGDPGMAEVLEIAGLGTAVDRKVGSYSQGMRQRLGIAQAMLGKPELLLLDEPTNGLDPPQIKEMRDVLHRYAESGRTVIISSHMLSEVEQTCTDVVVMHRGRLVGSGSVADLLRDSANRRLEDVFLEIVGDDLTVGLPSPERRS